jgi:DNA helicase TIP49 (TBP-interacting protein)
MPKSTKTVIAWVNATAKLMGGIDTKAVLICGPTASGKSAPALEMAREFGGAVINAGWRNQG